MVRAVSLCLCCTFTMRDNKDLFITMVTFGYVDFLYGVSVTYQSSASDHRAQQEDHVLVDLLILLHQQVKDLQKTQSCQTQTEELQRPHIRQDYFMWQTSSEN